MQSNSAKLGLQPLEAFVDKIIQLYEMIVVRHGLMLVGQSYGMKTAAHTVLAAALSDLHEKVRASFPLQSGKSLLYNIALLIRCMPYTLPKVLAGEAMA